MDVRDNDRADKEAWVFDVMDDRKQENLLGSVKKKAFTINDNLNDEDTFNTRRYSDFFASYQPVAFKEACYKLHRCKPFCMVWFWFVHTNYVEGLWSQLKRLIKDFSGLSIAKISKLEDKGVVNIKTNLILGYAFLYI